ncbi:hypothetical protein CXQ85_001546 [Candidozyma haemuli]|uniref:Uncharacterized protein n=1 Tax=Candidozyma haemuli TaxID=45357 RepID=A0A2V1AN70_9ASCO|nr:hypothetical protein CXQ85_001546 [[Candida] haemuloni]PVH19245.1 hypothetical protein CXQ85_001546 [[Candida] haemuloni]
MILVNWILSLYEILWQFCTEPAFAVTSGTYVYPFQGIIYFFNNSDIWPFYGAIIIPQFLFMLAVYAVMYVAVYPLYALLSFVAFGPFGVVSAFFTVLQYSNMISNFLISVVLMPGARDVVFDAVLSREGQDYVVFQEKLRRKHKKSWKVKITTVKTFLFCKLPEIILLELLILLVGIIPVIVSMGDTTS